MNAISKWLSADFNPNSPLQAPLFILQILSFAITGVLAGAGVEWIVERIPRDDTQSAKCGGLVVLQLTIIAMIIFLVTVISKRDMYSLMRSHWRGYLFMLTFFVAQGSISANIQCMLRLNYI